MRFLFSLAFKERKYLPLIIITMVSMLAATISTQMEIITLGVLTKKGPGFFELFGPMENGKVVDTAAITEEELLTRFREIGNGSVTKEEVNAYLDQHGRKGLVDRASDALKHLFDFQAKPLNLALLMFIVALLNAASMFAHRFSTRMISVKVSSDLRQKYFEHIQTLSMSFYGKQNIGGLSSRVVADSSAISDGVNATLINFLQTPFAIVSTLFLCFIASWKLTAMIFIGLPLIAIPIRIISRHIKRITKQLQSNQETFSAVLIDFLAGIQTVKFFGREEYSLEKYSQENERMEALQQKIAKYDVSSRPIVHTLGMTFLASALIAGLYLFQMSVPEVIVYCGLLYVFYEPIKKFAETNATIQRGAAAAERMQEVLRIKPEIEDAPNAVTLLSFQSEIEFRDVWFRYGEEWILKGVSFTIKKGETTAIVGPTGAGKSTLIQLLPRLYEVEKGEILVDGLPLQAYTQESLRRLMAYVPQKPFLFLDTIAKNISFGAPYTRKQVQEAATKANANEFIEKLPDQYETRLAEMGKNLSGGQQQRLAIARALFRNSPILVLDEATSSLDAVSENHIKQAVKNLKGEMTQIIIAHRLSTIEDADNIIYLENGKVIDQGSKQSLLKTCPPFKLMWDMMHKEAVHA